MFLNTIKLPYWNDREVFVYLFCPLTHEELRDNSKYLASFLWIAMTLNLIESKDRHFVCSTVYHKLSEDMDDYKSGAFYDQ